MDRLDHIRDVESIELSFPRERRRSFSIPTALSMWHLATATRKKNEGMVWNPALTNGFAKSAKFIVRDEDKTSALFRRFDTSSMRNLLYLQARVASLTARQEAFDTEDFEAFNDQASLEPNDPKNPEVRLRNLKLRLETWTKDLPATSARPRMSNKETFEQRIKDLALCLDYPLQPLRSLPDRQPFQWPKFDSLSYATQKRPRPLKEALLGSDQMKCLENIISIVEYRVNADAEAIKEYIGYREDREYLIDAMEYLLQDSLVANFERQIVPDQLLDFNMSWEDMVMFGNHDIWYRRKGDWDIKREKALNRGDKDPGEWPWGKISNYWIDKMRERYAVAMELKGALKEYHEALMTQRAVFQLPQPAERTKRAQAGWFRGVLGNDIPQFINSSADIFDADMVSIGTTGSDDFLSKKLPEWIPSLFIAVKRSDKKVRYTSEKKVGRLVGIINGAAAIGFLVVAVWVLSVVSGYKTDNNIRATKIELGVLTGFVVLFALWIGFFTTLSKKEVFGAVATYAAVLVVFVGGSGS